MKFLHSHLKTHIKYGDKAYLLPPYDIGTVIGCYVATTTSPEFRMTPVSVHNRLASIVVKVPDVSEGELRKELPPSEVFFKKADRDVAFAAVQAFHAVYEGQKGYETVRRRHRIQKRERCVTVRMLDITPENTASAMYSAWMNTMDAIPPYCFRYRVSNSVIGDIEFKFPSGIPNPKLNPVILRAPHAFAVGGNIGKELQAGTTITKTEWETRIITFLWFLSECGFDYDRDDMNQLLPDTPYYNRSFDKK